VETKRAEAEALRQSNPDLYKQILDLAAGEAAVGDVTP
jgi:hypothetical protein